ncbi:MAG: hypothetical protein R8M45_09850 [Ghiorsea sp.]
MHLSHATMLGAISGACLGFAICMFNDITLVDTLFRMVVLSIGGAWIGFLLAWLNIILPPAEHQEHE